MISFNHVGAGGQNIQFGAKWNYNPGEFPVFPAPGKMTEMIKESIAKDAPALKKALEQSSDDILFVIKPLLSPQQRISTQKVNLKNCRFEVLPMLTNSSYSLPKPEGFKPFSFVFTEKLGKIDGDLENKLLALITRGQMALDEARPLHELTSDRFETTNQGAETMRNTGRTKSARPVKIANAPPPIKFGPENATGLARLPGQPEIKREIMKRVINPARFPERYKKYDLPVPNAVCLIGPQGTGKTLLARQIAEELGANYKEVRPSSNGDIHIHETAKNINKMFEAAAELNKKTGKRTVLLLDEAEVMVPRKKGSSSSNHTNEEVAEMQKHLENAQDYGVLVLLATNHPELIERAVLRPGRTGAVVYLGLPNGEEQKEMLEFHLMRRFKDPDIDLDKIIPLMHRFSPADIEAMVNDAALEALEENESGDPDKDPPISERHLIQAAKSRKPSVSEKDEQKFAEYFEEEGVIGRNPATSSRTCNNGFGFPLAAQWKGAPAAKFEPIKLRP